MFIFWKY